MTVLASAGGDLEAQFTEWETKSQYIMTGSYDPESLAFHLSFSSWLHQPAGSSWVPCDARGSVTRDLSTATGDAVCGTGVKLKERVKEEQDVCP
jgi:hypothetical protein